MWGRVDTGRVASRSRRPRGRSKWQQASAEDRPLGTGARSVDTTEHHSDGSWVVRRISGSSSTKDYTCPGCFQRIRPATPHVVAWPDARPLLGGQASDARRHWHTTCWGQRSRAGR